MVVVVVLVVIELELELELELEIEISQSFTTSGVEIDAKSRIKKLRIRLEWGSVEWGLAVWYNRPNVELRSFIWDRGENEKTLSEVISIEDMMQPVIVVKGGGWRRSSIKHW